MDWNYYRTNGWDVHGGRFIIKRLSSNEVDFLVTPELWSLKMNCQAGGENDSPLSQWLDQDLSILI